MTLPASIRINVRAPFPARVKGAAFLTVSKANGVWTLTPDYTLLAPSIGISATQIVAVFDTSTGTWGYVNASALSSPSQIYRIITAAGAVAVQNTDRTIVLQKSPSGASTINLPAAASRSGVPITVKDLTGDAATNAITFVPSGTETIDGFSAAAAAANGAATIDIDYGSKTLYPLQSGGWYSL